jgi:hypothetical protein
MPIAHAPQHSVTIAENRQAKKAGGVYYTPAYIVDFIVKQTIGKAVSGQTPVEISQLKIVDPSCGSGNFLSGAYQFLLDWHRDYYNNDQPDTSIKKTMLTEKGGLAIAEKKRILLNNIYGVDLDADAAEATRRILVLKCMEDEQDAQTTVDNSLLSLLSNNIKTGNSLVDTDFDDAKEIEDSEKKIKAFNWPEEFPAVFSDGGFDIVIGNPPYGAALTKAVQTYCLQKFGTGNTDTAAFFMIHANQILKVQGYTGYIVPKAFTYASNWKKTRNELLPGISLVADCSNVWTGVKLEMCIYISRKGLATTEFTSFVRKGQAFVEMGMIDKSLCEKFNFILNGVSEKEMLAGIKLYSSPKRLNDFFTNKRGAALQEQIDTKGDHFAIGGKQVRRYHFKTDIKRQIKKSGMLDENAFIKKESLLVQNIVAYIQNPIPHIQITAAMADSITATDCFILDTVNQLTNRSNLSPAYLLGVLNSSPVSWYTFKFVFANAIRTMHFDNTTTARIPFPDIDLENKTHKTKYDEIIRAVEQIAELAKRAEDARDTGQRQEKINILQLQIDTAVCELFGLNKKETELLTKSN